MTEQVFQYAEEMMRYQQKNVTDERSMEARLNQLNEQLALTASRCLSADYCPAVTTQKRGIAGKLVLIMKRVARKSTFFIVRDLSQEIANFQKEVVNTLSNMIELQEEILIELVSMKNTNTALAQTGDIARGDQSEGDVR